MKILKFHPSQIFSHVMKYLKSSTRHSKFYFWVFWGWWTRCVATCWIHSKWISFTKSTKKVPKVLNSIFYHDSLLYNQIELWNLLVSFSILFLPKVPNFGEFQNEYENQDLIFRVTTHLGFQIHEFFSNWMFFKFSRFFGQINVRKLTNARKCQKIPMITNVRFIKYLRLFISGVQNVIKLTFE